MSNQLAARLGYNIIHTYIRTLTTVTATTAVTTTIATVTVATI